MPVNNVEEIRSADSLHAQLGRERRARQHRLEIDRLVAETSGQVTREGVAEVLVAGASKIFNCRWAMIAFIESDEIVKMVHGPEVPSEVFGSCTSVPLSAVLPTTDVLRGDRDVCELVDRSEFAPWPDLVAHAEQSGYRSLFVEPIPDGDRPAAAVVLAWSEAHKLDEAERELINELVVGVATAFARSANTESDQELATTLQNSLLPARLPAVEGLDIAVLYEAGRKAQDVGGDWYDVVKLDDRRSAIVIGDVMGHDARAAGEMGQIRHVLAAHLLATGDPSESLRLADQYFHVRSFNTMATALVIVFDSFAATVELASAGHLFPVMAELGELSVVVESGLGPPIGSGLGGYRSLVRLFPHDAVLVAFTDGVVELRNEDIDDSIGHFCRAIDQAIETAARCDQQQATADAIVDMITSRVADPNRTDDAAAIVFRNQGHND
ncbi:MAG: serine phosphatase RsbU (regulator of sigma subunit) [Minisyncoccia bacterium]|jgi:serine phosphatase RsbU (regulator of sigma subunit)